jgi:hypothetical protein
LEPALSHDNPWKDVIIEALIVSCIYRNEHENDPRKALADLLAWEVAVALDPKVSKEARDLLHQTPPENLSLSEIDTQLPDL